MKRSSLLLPLLIALTVTVSTPSANAKRPRHRASDAVASTRFGDPTKLPADRAQNLVSASKIPPFYDPANLSHPPVLSAKSAVLIDVETGEILWEKNSTVREYPASTTKIMTCLLLAERTKPDDIITCTDPKIRQIEESSLHIQPWEKFTSENLLMGTMLRSANDGAVVIAEHLAGSVPKFADMMNERAREAGATDTHFHNPNGLPDTEHWTTARDLAKIARAALLNDRFHEAVRLGRRTIDRSTHKDMIVSSKAQKFYETFPGADGVKTGYTRAAKHCFVGSATRDGRQMIGVVLGANGNVVVEMVPLLGWGFRRFPTVVAMKQGMAAPAITVAGGVKSTLQTVVGADLATFQDANATAPVVQTVAVALPHLTAPITKGQVVGRLVAKVDGKERGSAPLLAAEEVSAAPIDAVTKNPVGKIALWSVGAGAVFLIGLACYGTASAKNARRRRNRLPPPSRRIDYGGTGDSERGSSLGPGNERRPGARLDRR